MGTKMKIIQFLRHLSFGKPLLLGIKPRPHPFERTEEVLSATLTSPIHSEQMYY